MRLNNNRYKNVDSNIKSMLNIKIVDNVKIVDKKMFNISSLRKEIKFLLYFLQFFKKKEIIKKKIDKIIE